MVSRHYEDSRIVAARPEVVFAFVDDHVQFSSHMNQSSWMMGGGRMSTSTDDNRGQAVGSHIRMAGRILGVRLSLDEVVTIRTPPTDKVWQTVGTPTLMVIGRYRMGVEIRPEPDGSRVRVFIDFELPDGIATYWLGRLFGRMYAKWCVGQMLRGVAMHFDSAAVQ